MSRRFLCAFLLFAFSLSFNAISAAQLGGLVKHKEKETKPVNLNEQAPDLTDSDKKKLAEIEQRPEVKDEIEALWQAQRRQDMEYAYRVNTSTRRSVSFDPSDDALLYDNPILQRYLNRIGQGLVPNDSPNVYSFKLLYSPLPMAEALSTGTIYVSTGLVALLDNEAQLSYVLAHEVAHVEKNHAYMIIKNRVLEDELNHEREADAAKKRAIFSAIAAGAGAGIGAAAGGGRGALAGAFIGLGGGYIASSLIFRAKTSVTEWPTVYENEADEAGFKYMLNRNYDAREIPKLYARLEGVTTKDARAGLGFIGKPERVKERKANIQSLLSGTYKSDIDAKLKAKGLVGSSADFPLLMSGLKRDNGIIALDYDLFAMARDNLEEAVNLRSSDASAQFYLGRVISITARTDDDRREAQDHIKRAIGYDEGRGAYPDPHLERALDMIGSPNPDNQEVRKELQSYVALYQREHSGSLPRNMAIIYDYFTLAGDTTWYVPPASVVSTKNVEALTVNTGGGSALNAKQVLQNATSAPDVQPAVMKDSGTTHPKTKPVSQK